MINILRILVPVDFSKESRYALDWAKLVASKTPGATLYLLHVLPPSPEGMGTVAYKAEQEGIERKLQAVQDALPKEMLSFTMCEVGKIHEVIQRVCENKDINLVVMTTRGRRGLKHFLPESVTEETVRLAPCPVLVLHLNSKAPLAFTA